MNKQDWIFGIDKYDESKVVDNSRALMLANGYFGCSGTLEEHTKQQFALVNLAGVYDRFGDKWRETVNAPNPFYGFIRVKGESDALSCENAAQHSQSVCLRHGIGSRRTEWVTSTGRLCFATERFLSMDNAHLMASRWEITAQSDCQIEIFTGIDSDVYDCNGPHLFNMKLSEDDKTLTTDAITGELGIGVCTAARISSSAVSDVISQDGKILTKLNVSLKAGGCFVLEKYCAIYTQKDCADPHQAAKELVEQAERLGYDALKSVHKARWETIWHGSEVRIEGDASAQRALNFSMHHLHSIAPRHTKGQSIPARGLSGQTYKGAVFWDTEIFMLPFFLFTEPCVARDILEYRIAGLKGARDKAREYGFEGAFFAWESQEEGVDACTNYNVTDVFSGRPQRTYFRDKQLHISGDIAYAFWNYVTVTGDYKLLFEGGMELIIECARFYRSCAYTSVRRGSVEFLDVIGPDEYHERVNNNVFTNRMIKCTFEIVGKAYELLLRKEPERAKTLLASLLKDGEIDTYAKLSEDTKLLEPDVRADSKTHGVVEQFDGYFSLEDCTVDEVRQRLLHPNEYWGGGNGVAAHTQIIKQADVLTLMQLFPGDYSDEEVRRNWEYYMPRTEHGSSLSACMYALTACRIGRADEAYSLFMETATIDMKGSGKCFAGDIYIGGMHSAAAGGAWMTAVLGFGGFALCGGELCARPALPSEWKSLSFRIRYAGKLHEMSVTRDGTNMRIVEQD